MQVQLWDWEWEEESKGIDKIRACTILFMLTHKFTCILWVFSPITAAQVLMLMSSDSVEIALNGLNDFQIMKLHIQPQWPK